VSWRGTAKRVAVADRDAIAVYGAALKRCERAG